MRRTALRSKRETPRRKAPERVEHQRQKPRAGAAPTAEEKRHLARVAMLPCLVCGARPVQVYHVTSDGFARIARSHRRVTPLCATHHKVEFGRESVEALSHAGFTIMHGIDLLAVADRLWEESRNG